MKISGKQIAKSLLGLLLGATPGVLLIVFTHMYAFIAVTLLGAFVGFALTLPGVSAKRVAGGTVGMIAAHNAPRSMQAGIMNAMLGDEEESERQPNQEGKPNSGSEQA